MAQLTKGMYQIGPRKPAVFGLTDGQTRRRDMVHNGGWYNRAGEKLGWGDLSPKDFQRISKELEGGELFIVLRETDSFWNFVVYNPGTTGGACVTEEAEKAPGVEYMIDHCAFIIERGELYYVDRCKEVEEETFLSRDGLEFRKVGVDGVRTMLKPNNP